MSQRILKSLLLGGATVVAATSLLVSCGGGGGGGTRGGNTIIYYPFENVFGDICVGDFDPTPGCTFNRDDGTRVDVTQSIDYNYLGGQEDDLVKVEFRADGFTADLFDEFGAYIGTRDISTFDGWKGGTFIGVGTTGVFWEDVTLGNYLLDSNGVLYSNNLFENNFFEAINNYAASMDVNTDVLAINDARDEAKVAAGAKSLMTRYGFEADKAQAVASNLYRFANNVATRGYSRPEDIKAAFKATFSVDLADAMAAAEDLFAGKPEAMQQLTTRAASNMGILPRQAEAFLKDSYERALASEFGYQGGLDW